MPGSLLTLFLKSIDGYHIQETGALCLHWRAVLKRSDPCGVKLGDEKSDNSKIKGVPTNRYLRIRLGKSFLLAPVARFGPELQAFFTKAPGLATNSIFICFLFVKNHWFAWRANQWPLVGETLFSSVPPSNSLVSVSDPWRAFWADTAPFKGPRLASCVASGTTEIQGHLQVCRARRGGPRTPSKIADANLDCAFVENALFYTDPWLWKVNRIRLS